LSFLYQNQITAICNHSAGYTFIAMKKLPFLLVFLFILDFVSSKAQSSWTRLSGSPQENTLNCIRKIPGTNKLIAVGEGSTVMISEDAGQNWQLILNPAGRDNYYICKGVCFIDDTTGFINGGKESILKTIDGGLSWDLKYIGNTIYEGKYFYEIEFTNRLNGFAVGDDGQLFKTTDTGESWHTIPSGVSFGLGLIEFADTITGFIAGACDSILLKTSDGGNNWSLIDFPSGLPKLEITSIHFISDSVGFISGFSSDNTLIFKTTDKGITWMQVHSSGLQGAGEFVFFDELSGFYTLPTPVMYSSVIISTNDGGNTWTETWPTSLSWLDTYSTFTFDENIAFSVGKFGALNKSTNQGLSWDPLEIKIFSGNVSTVQFLNPDEGFAVSDVSGGGVAQSVLMKTNDGGLSWNRIDKFYFYKGVFNFLNSDTGFLASYSWNTSINKTTNGGNTWTGIGTGFNFMPNTIKFYDHNNGLLGGNGNMIITSDGGITWHAVTIASIFNYDFKDIEYRSADTVFAVSGDWSQHVMLKSIDGGNNWTEVLIDYSGGANDIFFVDDNTAFLALNNTILKSIDGGNTWSPTTINNPNPIYFKSIHFPTPEIGYAVGRGQFENMFKTTDGGNTWNPIVTTVTSNLNSVYFSTSENGLVFGNNGVMLKTTTGGITAMEKPVQKPEEAYFEVFPNPVTDVVNIKLNRNFDHKGAEIIIMDMVGRKLKTVPIEYYTTTLKLNLEHFSTGIYLFQYVSKIGFLDSKKVIVH